MSWTVWGRDGLFWGEFEDFAEAEWLANEIHGVVLEAGLYPEREADAE